MGWGWGGGEQQNGHIELFELGALVELHDGRGGSSRTATSSCSTARPGPATSGVRPRGPLGRRAHLARASRDYSANSVHSPIGRLPPDGFFRLWEGNSRERGQA